MSHRDEEITEVVVVINKAWCDKLKEAVANMVAVGFEVFSTDEDECVVAGSIEAYKLPQLEKVECVSYVRTVDTYIADFPDGDSRNKDTVDDDEDAAEAV